MRATVINPFKNRINFFAVFVQFDEVNISFFCITLSFIVFASHQLKIILWLIYLTLSSNFLAKDYLIVKQLDMIRYCFEKHSMKHTFKQIAGADSFFHWTS